MTQAQFERALVDALDRAGYMRLPEQAGPDDQAEPLARLDVQDLLDTVSDEIAAGLRRRGETAVAVRGLGRFRLARRKARKARMGRNPATGEPLKIAAKPASKALKVTADRWLRDELKVK